MRLLSEERGAKRRCYMSSFSFESRFAPPLLCEFHRSNVVIIIQSLVAG